MNICGTGFSYTKLRLSQQVELSKIIHQETVHLLIRLTVYNYDKVISLHKELICFCTYKKKHNYVTTNIKLISKT
jgi:hypothetical protein